MLRQTAIRLADVLTRKTELRQRCGLILAPGQLLTSARRVRAGNVSGDSGVCRGRVAIQDEASQLVGCWWARDPGSWTAVPPLAGRRESWRSEIRAPPLLRWNYIRTVRGCCENWFRLKQCGSDATRTYSSSRQGEPSIASWPTCPAPALALLHTILRSNGD